MKKLILGLSALVTLFSACSKTDDVATTPVTATTNYILPKTLTTVNAVNGSSSTTQITYNGNKIIQSIDGTTKEVYTYTGDLITKVEKINANVVSRTTDYVYNSSNDLISSLQLSTGNTYKTKIVYTYNSDGTIGYTESNVDISPVLETIRNIGKLTILNGNIIKREYQTPVFSGNINGNISTNEYDTKNSFAKNILGFSKLYEFTGANGQNNLIKTTSVSSSSYNGVNNPSNTTITTHSFLYNIDNYPTEQKNFYNGNLESTSQYTY